MFIIYSVADQIPHFVWKAVIVLPCYWIDVGDVNL